MKDNRLLIAAEKGSSVPTPLASLIYDRFVAASQLGCDRPHFIPKRWTLKEERSGVAYLSPAVPPASGVRREKIRQAVSIIRMPIPVPVGLVPVIPMSPPRSGYRRLKSRFFRCDCSVCVFSW